MTTPWQDYLWMARFSKEVPSIAEVLRAALSGETEQVDLPMRVEWDKRLPEHFDEAMKVTDADFHDEQCKGWIVMNPRSYADVRKFGRNVLDLETCAPRPLTGATLWGYPILTTRDVEPGVVWIVGRRRNGSWARLKMEWDWQGDAESRRRGGGVVKKNGPTRLGSDALGTPIEELKAKGAVEISFTKNAGPSFSANGPDREERLLIEYGYRSEERLVAEGERPRHSEGAARVKVEERVWCDACRKTVVLRTGRECSLEEGDCRFDDYVAVTGLLPCSRAVEEAARRVQGREGS